MTEDTRPQSQLTGVAGVHFVAALLSYRGFHAVPTTRNVLGPDLLVSTLDGDSSLSIQVKTTLSAMRTQGRGDLKKPHHYEWDIGWSSARLNADRLLFALVDLNDFQKMPDVFFVPSFVIYKYFEGGNPETWIRARFHPEIHEVEQYKNDVGLVASVLSVSPQ